MPEKPGHQYLDVDQHNNQSLHCTMKNASLLHMQIQTFNNVL